MSTITPEAAVLLVAMAAAAGTLGCFVVMRRMVLAADALSHVALPGIGIALLANVHPLAGALAALLAGTLVIWGIERRSRLATETVIGVVFTASLAGGAMLTSGDELVEALLGKPAALAPWELALAVGGALAVIAFLWLRRHAILVALFSRDIAASLGIRLAWLDLQFMLAFAVTVALGLRYLGVLLMGSLVIIPAATAKRLAGNLRTMMLIAIAVALIATLAGTSIGVAAGTETGPPIVLVAAGLFLASLLRRPSG
jgi:ABC-type Mn2+/Zn2+ transport system permease subunit